MFYASEPHLGVEFSRKKLLEQPLSPQNHMFFQSNLQAIFRIDQLLQFQDTAPASQLTVVAFRLPAGLRRTGCYFRRAAESEGAVFNAVIVLTGDRNPDLQLPA
jgi:hypothetical protein